MNFRNLVIFFSLVIPFVCYSSDNIHLKSGQIIECKVLSIDTNTVTIEILKNGIKRTYNITDIKVIIYEDGTAEVFSDVKSEPTGEMKQRTDEPENKSSQSGSGWDGERKGFILGFGLGLGSLNFTQEVSYAGNSASASESHVPLITNFKIGYAFTNQILLYWSSKVSWFSLENALDETVTISAGTGTVALSYFWIPQAPSWFVSGGIGYSTWDTPFEKNGDPWTGTGFFLGGGYEFSKHKSIEGGLYLGNPSKTVGNIDVTIAFNTLFLTLNVLGY